MDDFDELYQLWPNKRDKANTKLAYDYVTSKHQLSRGDYLKAAELWSFKANDFTRANQQLANWLRDEKFLVELQEIASSGGLAQALHHAGMFRDAAVVVAGEWNRLRAAWWSSVENIKDRSYLVETALRNEFWQANWSKALHIAANVLKYAARDSIGNIVLKPNLAWFCDLKENTVSKLMEGDYG